METIALFANKKDYSKLLQLTDIDKKGFPLDKTEKQTQKTDDVISPSIQLVQSKL